MVSALDGELDRSELRILYTRDDNVRVGGTIASVV
jgi:hypothetical protein